VSADIDNGDSITTAVDSDVYESTASAVANNYYDKTITHRHLHAVRGQKYSAGQRQHKRRKIFLVDDEPDHSLLYQMILEDAGYECTSHTDPLKAMEEFIADYYELIVLDIKMPALNGLELGKKIREQDNAVRIIFITASEVFYGEFRNRHYSELSDIYYIQKPVKNEELLRRVNEMIDKSNDCQANRRIRYFLI
jgi:DNA-binding NtrC family response regulator